MRTPPAPAGPRALLTPAALHILLALAEGDRHGYGIKQDVERRTGGSLNLGPATLYEAIHRMLKTGWIEEARRRADADSRRRTYRVTAEGRRQLDAELARLDEIVRYARSRDLLDSPRRP